MRGPGNYWKETTVTLTGAQRTLERDYSDADGGSENAYKGPEFNYSQKGT
jgi:hypothetical protein